MEFLRIWSIILIYFSLSSSCNSKHTGGHEDRSKRIKYNQVREIVTQLTNLVENLKLDQFTGDTVLTQHVDKLNAYTTYKLPRAGRLERSTYERKSNDKGKKAIVLLPSEDKVFSVHKRTYVGLRSTESDREIQEYFVFFIYLRNPGESEDGTVQIGSDKKIIEFDAWVDRDDQNSIGFGWNECSSSIFVSCKTSDDSSMAIPRKKKSKMNSIAQVLKKHEQSQSLETIKTEEGFDADLYADFFWDLDNNNNKGIPATARFLGFGEKSTTEKPGFLSSLFGGKKTTTPEPKGFFGGVADAAKGALSKVHDAVANFAGDVAAGAAKAAVVNKLKGEGGTAVAAIKGMANAVVNRVTGNNRKKPAAKKKVSGRKRRAIPYHSDLKAEVQTSLFDYPGWKTMDEAGRPGDTLTHETAAFVGFGPCKYEPVTKLDYDVANSPEAVINVIATSLRTQCVRKQVESYNDLVMDGFLRMNSDQTFDIPRDNKILNMDKLAPIRHSDLSRAFEMSIFSKAFKRELNNEKPLVAPWNSTLSRRVHVLGEAVLGGIELIRSKWRHHEIKLLRSLSRTVQTAFMKLLQDHEAIQECEQCVLDKEVNLADELHLMTLIQFIFHGLHPLDKNSESVGAAFKFFNQANQRAIHQLVKCYL